MAAILFRPQCLMMSGAVESRYSTVYRNTDIGYNAAITTAEYR